MHHGQRSISERPIDTVRGGCRGFTPRGVHRGYRSGCLCEDLAGHATRWSELCVVSPLPHEEGPARRAGPSSLHGDAAGYSRSGPLGCVHVHGPVGTGAECGADLASDRQWS